MSASKPNRRQEKKLTRHKVGWAWKIKERKIIKEEQQKEGERIGGGTKDAKASKTKERGRRETPRVT